MILEKAGASISAEAAILTEGNVSIGQTSSVPIYLISTVELTNLNFVVIYPAERFTNLTVWPDTNVLGTNIASGQFLVSFDLPADQILYGPTNVADLWFTATTNQSSAFVPLRIMNVTGVKPDGTTVANAFGYPGRVVVVGREPLLEAILHTNRQPALIVYALPGSTNHLESKTTLDVLSTWAGSDPSVVVPSNSLFKIVEPITVTNGSLFYRASRE